MTSIIEPELINADELPGIWSPVQWELTPEEQATEIEDQARASLLWSVDVPEAMLRFLLRETDIERAYDPPSGYNAEQQGEWDEEIITFQFKRPIKLLKVEREQDYLYVEYDFREQGIWAMSIEPENMTITRIR